MKTKIKELTDKSISVRLEYEGNRFSSYVACTLIRPYYRHLPIYTYRSTDLEALENAEKLLLKVTEFEKLHGNIKPPTEAYYDKKYYRENIVDNDYVEIKAVDSKFVIRKLYKQTKDGFIIHETAIPINDEYKLLRDFPHRDALEYMRTHVVEKLHEDEEIYWWDDCAALSGSMGIAIGRNGVIVRSHGIWMS